MKIFNLYGDEWDEPRHREGWRRKDGAHQIINRTDSTIRVLMFSSMVGPDIVEYLDTGKVFATSVGGDPIMLARPGPTVEYWEGEE
jgi:uncharacterized cupin superfamily protein